MPARRFSGKAIPTGDDIAEGVHRLLKGIAESIGMKEKEKTTLSPSTELAYQQAEELRRSRNE